MGTIKWSCMKLQAEIDISLISSSDMLDSQDRLDTVTPTTVGTGRFRNAWVNPARPSLQSWRYFSPVLCTKPLCPPHSRLPF